MWHLLSMSAYAESVICFIRNTPQEITTKYILRAFLPEFPAKNSKWVINNYHDNDNSLPHPRNVYGKKNTLTAREIQSQYIPSRDQRTKRLLHALPISENYES